MPHVPQVAQQISQEENQQQNGPNLSSLLNSLPAAHTRSPALPQQVQPAGWDKNHVLVVPAPVPSQHADLSLFDVIGMENQITCYEAQVLPKLKVIGKLIEEICYSPSPPRLEPVKLKPNKHFRGSKDPLQELILTLKQQQIALKEVITREPVCVPSCSCCSSMFVWSKSFLQMDPWNETLAVQSQGTEMVQHDSGVSHTDVITVVFHDTDLDLLMDTKTKGWCDKIAGSRDIHTYRLESGNSIEERLLKKSIEHMIQELAAQGGDYSTDFLSQVLAHVRGVVNSCNYVNHSPKQCKNRYIKTIADAEGKNVGGHPL